MNDTLTNRKLVRDLMTVGVATCLPDVLVSELARLFLNKELEDIVVLNEEGHALGVVSQDDLIRAYTRDGARELRAEDVMTDGVEQVPPDIPLSAAAQFMIDRKCRALFLMHHASGIEYPAALITYKHLLRHLAAQSEDDLKDLGVAAARKAPLEDFIQRRDAARARAQTHHEE